MLALFSGLGQRLYYTNMFTNRYIIRYKSGLNENGYNPPPGFCFDWVCEGDQPIMDDKRLHDYNVDDVIRRFKLEAEKQRAHFRGNNIMMTMGSDFQDSCVENNRT